MFDNPFIPKADTYQRKITPIQDYIEQAATFLSREKNISFGEAKEYVRKMTMGKEYPGVRFPNIHYLQREENGDRVPRCVSLINYMKDALRNHEIIAPTLTTYLPENVKESILVRYVDGNIKKRSMSKKAMFAARAAKQEITELFEDGKQRNFKLSNNAISGAHASSSNPLFNPTSHSTLTSNCRMTSAFGNANNEKLLSGNRHYHNPNIVLNNIVSITTHTDYIALQSVITKYQIHLPSTEEVMETIQYSSDLYWINPTAIKDIAAYVDKLSPIEKAAFVYTGDLYHLKKYNEMLVQHFVRQLAQKKTTPVEDALSIMKECPDDIAALAHQICSTEMSGRGKNYAKMTETPEGTESLQHVASTVKHIYDVLQLYQDFIKIFFVSDNVPASVSHFPSSIRRSALTSDTDSTIFTVQDWVLWLNNGRWWGERAVAYGSALVFLASQSIIHILARMSINNGIQKEKMYKIAMKNEYYFPVFIPTSVNKHYFASISCQEGNVYDKLEREVKGVHLKNSNSPKFIIKHANDIMNEIMDTVASGQKLSIMHFIHKVADIERGIYKGVLAGEKQYFRSGVIKRADSYSNEPERSPYFHYMLWKEVFSPKYGDIGETPIDVINISTTLSSPMHLEQYLNTLTDQELAGRFRNFLETYGRKNLNTIQVPVSAISMSGLPEEIVPIINARSIVINLCKIFYLILETIGFNVLNKKSTFLVSDRY